MFCEKVRIVLAMKKVPYEVADVRKDERKSLIEFTGQRKVPSMDYNGKCVIDSTVISALLEKDYPASSIYPDGAAAKGLCLALEDWSDEVLIHANHAMRRAETPEARKKAEEDWAVHFRTLDQIYTGKRFVFDRLSRHFLPTPLSLHGGKVRDPGRIQERTCFHGKYAPDSEIEISRRQLRGAIALNQTVERPSWQNRRTGNGPLVQYGALGAIQRRSHLETRRATDERG
jgi:glutaredoxin